MKCKNEIGSLSRQVLETVNEKLDRYVCPSCHTKIKLEFELTQREVEKMARLQAVLAVPAAKESKFFLTGYIVAMSAVATLLGAAFASFVVRG